MADKTVCKSQQSSSQTLSLQQCREQLVGKDSVISTPFTRRAPCLYADYVASGRAIEYIERFIKEQVLPFHANTHTEVSACGRYIGNLRESSREYIRKAVHANDDYAIIFCGSGSTAAIRKMADALGLAVQRAAESHTDEIEATRAVVLISGFEHHSNILPWRESGAIVEQVDFDTATGTMCLVDLKKRLEKYKEYTGVKIGSFSAASNVTGILPAEDTALVCGLLHQHGFLAFWDYACAGPYADIQMVPRIASSGAGACNAEQMKGYKDAVFISTHKFMGGPQTPGVLIARSELFRNEIPTVPGGGTVAFVTKSQEQYLPCTDTRSIEAREEGGTPAIVESIRAGMVFDLKSRIGVETINHREELLVQRAFEKWGNNPNIVILGGTKAKRLPIFALTFLHPFVPNNSSAPAPGGSAHNDNILKAKTERKAFHHNFIGLLLNDLFGIQGRTGCSCAGPYGEFLLGINENQVKEIQEYISQGKTAMKPGWTRLSLHYLMTDEEVEYILMAVDWIATCAWTLLPMYTLDYSTGEYSFTPTPRFKQVVESLRGASELLLNGQPRPRTESGRLILRADQDKNDLGALLSGKVTAFLDSPTSESSQSLPNSPCSHELASPTSRIAPPIKAKRTKKRAIVKGLLRHLGEKLVLSASRGTKHDVTKSLPGQDDGEPPASTVLSPTGSSSDTASSSDSPNASPARPAAKKAGTIFSARAPPPLYRPGSFEAMLDLAMKLFWIAKKDIKNALTRQTSTSRAHFVERYRHQLEGRKLSSSGALSSVWFVEVQDILLWLPKAAADTKNQIIEKKSDALSIHRLELAATVEE